MHCDLRFKVDGFYAQFTTNLVCELRMYIAIVFNFSMDTELVVAELPAIIDILWLKI